MIKKTDEIRIDWTISSINESPELPAIPASPNPDFEFHKYALIDYHMPDPYISGGTKYTISGTSVFRRKKPT